MPKGVKGFQKGQKFTKEHRDKISIATTRYRTGMKYTPELCAKLSEGKRGAKNPQWKGGVVSENVRLRHSAAFRKWRELVFSRDNWTCQICGIRGSIKLHPHHIRGFAEYPELRFDVENGLTVCMECHSDIHKRRLTA